MKHPFRGSENLIRPLPPQLLNESEFPIFRWLGIVGAVIGTSVAYITVPEEPRPAGALLWPAIWQAVGLLVAPAVAIAHKAVSMFRIENTVAGGLVYWLLLDLIQGSYEVPVNRPAVQSAFVMIGLFAVSYWVGSAGGRWIGLPPVFRTVAAQNPSAKTLFRVIVIAFGLALLTFAVPSQFDPFAMIDGLTKPRFSAPWSRGAEGGWNAFVDHLQYFGYILPTLTVMLAYRTGRWIDARVVAAICLCLVISAFIIQSGSRRIIGTVFGAAIVCWILLQAGRVTFGTYLRLGGVIVGLLLLMQTMIEFRGEGVLNKLQSDNASMQSTTLRVDDNFLRVCQIVDWFPDRIAFVGEQYVVWVLIRPIPRVLWPDKPLIPGFDHGAEVGNSGTSLTSSIIGESYMSYGWLAVIIAGLVYGALSGLYSRILTMREGPSRIVLYGLAAMTIFAGLRSMIELVLMSYMLLAWMGLSLVTRALGMSSTPVAESGPQRVAQANP